MTNAHIKLFCDDISGIVWAVRIVQFGQRYGRNDCLVHDGQDPLVEFYDTRCEHTDCGQFVSRYTLGTMLENNDDDRALDLNGGVPGWTLSVACLKRVTSWLETNKEVFRGPSASAPFAVSVARMKESHRVTYLVVLDRTDQRNEQTSIFDDVGQITPFQTEELDHANSEASDWAKFLGVPFTPYVEKKAI